MGTTMIPAMSREQRMASLREANRIRQARSALTRRLAEMSQAEGCDFAADLLDDPPDVLGSMFVIDLLGKVRRLPEAMAEAMLLAAGIGVAALLDRTTVRQRSALAVQLRSRAGRLTQTERRREGVSDMGRADGC